MRVSMDVRRCQSIYARAFLLALWGATACSAQGVISTVAGTGANSAAGDGGPATNASFHPDGLALDGAGNIFIADQNHNRIRKVDTSGIITTFAGNGNTQFSGDGGPASSATVYIAGNHNGLAVDKDGNLFIADDGHHRIRKVDRNGIITTVAGTGAQGFSGDGGPATRAQLFRPSGVAVDTAGNLYIADTNNRRIRKVDSTGTITTLAGTGEFGNSGDGTAANQATMEAPVDVTVDVQGNVYFADQDAATVRKVSSAGIVSRVAGNGTFGFSGDGGPAVNAAFASPYSVTVDSLGNVFISDFGNHRIRKVDLNGILTTVAGNGSSAANNGDGGPPTSANISPNGVAFDSAGNYYVADFGNNRIRKVTVGARVPGLAVSASALYFSYTAGGNVPNAQIVTAEGTITLRTAAPDLPTVNIPVTLNVVATAPPRPVITPNGVVNGANFRPGVVANSLATIQGTNLASTTNTWSSALAGGQLPTSLDGVTVLFNGRPAYLAYISPTQINLIVPDISAGTTAVVLTNNGTSPTGLFTTPSSLYGSAFFTWPGNQVVATRQDYSYAVKSDTFAGLITAAAKPGDVVILWGTGFGPTAAPPGIPVPADKTYSTSTLPTVTINNVSATVYGAALASGYAGLYQVAIQVPDSLPDGDWPITATIGGVTSPPGTVLSVKR